MKIEGILLLSLLILIFIFLCFLLMHALGLHESSFSAHIVSFIKNHLTP